MRDLRAARCGPLLTLTGPITPLPPATRFVLRGAEAARDAAGTALGLSLPASPCRASSAGERAALWLGPDEWLLIAPETDAPPLSAALEQSLAGLAHSLVDVSHRQVGLQLQGAAAATLLAAGCPLDLDPAAFPLAMCTRTMLAKCEVILWRIAPQGFRIEVWRSFAPYVTQFLAEAGRGNI